MAIFSSTHYDALAKVIANTDRYDDGELIGRALVEAIIVMLAEENLAFDRPTFEANAGIADDGAGFAW
ncbi:MAG TPA: hypothetical protein VMF86_10910 [Stellaceae bacterium]|nr:hypothetical protein [Stellaceae bacterium]